MSAAIGPFVAALYVETGGCYAGLPGVEAWGGSDGPDGSTVVHRDAREYDGPWPVVAHPPCKRWGRFWHGSTRKPHQYELGDDGGCFMASLIAAHTWGGVIEHPADSHAFAAFGLPIPRGGRAGLSPISTAAGPATSSKGITGTWPAREPGCTRSASSFPS
jgi:hypothetical protein